MTTGARVVGALMALAMLAALVWGSNAPIAAHPSPDAVLRLAWSARPERIEVCREPGPEELARLPQHMRQARVCEGRTAEYRLQVRVDGRVLADRVVHGGGLRRDRRLYVFDELTIPPGEATIEVRFDRIDIGAGSAAAPAAPSPTVSGAPAQADERTAAVPPHLRLSRRLRFVSREAVLVTYVPERRELAVRMR